MYTLNQLTIIGFTGNDAEAHYTPNGTLVVTLSVATKESWKDADGNWQSRTDWHRVVTFGKLAESANAFEGVHTSWRGKSQTRLCYRTLTTFSTAARAPSTFHQR